MCSVYADVVMSDPMYCCQRLMSCILLQVAAVFGYDADVQLAPEPEPSAAGTEEGAAAAAAGSRRRGLTVQLSEVVSARLGRGPASKAVSDMLTSAGLMRCCMQVQQGMLARISDDVPGVLSGHQHCAGALCFPNGIVMLQADKP